MEQINPAWVVGGFAALLMFCAWFEHRNDNARDSRVLAVLGGGLGVASFTTAFFH